MRTFWAEKRACAETSSIGHAGGLKGQGLGPGALQREERMWAFMLRALMAASQKPCLI